MTWTTQRILDALADNREKLRAFGVQKIGLFGSYSRDTPRPDSDMDFLVVLERNTFDDYMGLKLFLEDFFGCGVDLVIEDSLRSELRPYVMADVRYVS
jgi:predicted nucleotidyltransferase